jgi:hypothetical protein
MMSREERGDWEKPWRVMGNHPPQVRWRHEKNEGGRDRSVS